MNQRFAPPPNPRRVRRVRSISGQGGMMGGKDGGSNSTTGGEEAPNTLKSKQTARVLDLLGEGPIRGVYGGLKGIYLDGVSVQEANGYMNFKNLSVQRVAGYPDQPIMSGFPSSEAEVPVGVKLLYNQPLVKHIASTDVDRCRVTVSVPTLQYIFKDTGNIQGNGVRYRIECNNNNGGWKRIGDYKIIGKTTSQYQRAVTFTLPKPGPWDIRVYRSSLDSTLQEDQRDIYWDSFTEIIDDRVNYSNSAMCGIVVDAEQFRTIPKRVYDVEGLLCRIPSNMNEDNGTYSPAIWNGSFSFAWTNNPAWVLYDLITNNRYGIGDYVPPSLVDKWSFYKIGQWCDQRVKGKGGVMERRYVCNVRITSQREAFDLLAQIASIFRGFCYWSGGKLIGVADQPADPVAIFTNANVIDGQFNYSSTDYRDRHTQVAVTWEDQTQMGQARLAVVEDQEAISRYGIQQLQETGFGCTSESQALRQGKWTLFTEQYEDDSIQFSTGLQGAYVRPGGIVKVMDANVAGRRRGGRLGVGSTATMLVLDSPMRIDAGHRYNVSAVVVVDQPDADGVMHTVAVVQTRDTGVIQATAMATVLHVSEPFSRVPQPDTPFVVTEPTLEATLWRALVIKQTDNDRYDIEGVRHYPQKWDYVEKGLSFSEPDISDIVAKPPPVTNLKVIEYIIQTSPISLAVRATLSWSSRAPLFDVLWHREDTNENWKHLRTDQNAIDLEVTDGLYEFQVTPIGTLGIKGEMRSITQQIIGLTALPDAPKQFRVNVLDSVAHFDWLPATEIDVIVGGHYELRFSTATSGATWNTAQTVIPSIPGSATSVETGYQVGTWMLRTFDITGRASLTWASVIALQADSRYQQFYRVCEQPGFLGTRNGTEVLMPEEWLIIGLTGGLWDDQLDDMDEWLDVDRLPDAGDSPIPPPADGSQVGLYYFGNRFDAGTAMSVRLGVDLLAFPYFEGEGWIDDRLTNVDDWEDWDDSSGDLGGLVNIYIRSTPDDPAGSPAWSDWKKFIPGEHYGRGFEFLSESRAPVGQNIGIEQMCITGDFRNKVDSGEDVPYSAVNTRVHFNLKFYTLPAVVITAQLMMAEDRIEITAKTREYFDVKITMTSSGTNPVGARSFDWHAQGY